MLSQALQITFHHLIPTGNKKKKQNNNNKKKKKEPKLGHPRFSQTYSTICGKITKYWAIN